MAYTPGGTTQQMTKDNDLGFGESPQLGIYVLLLLMSVTRSIPVLNFTVSGYILLACN